MMLVIFSPSPDSEAVNVSKFSSVSLIATSLSAITLSTLRSATRIFSWVLSVPSASAVSSGMPSAPFLRRRRLVRSAGEGDRRNAGQPLKFEADLGVAFHRRVAVDHGERHDAARMVELERHHFADPDAGKIHAAALAQARTPSLRRSPGTPSSAWRRRASDSRGTPRATRRSGPGSRCRSSDCWRALSLENPNEAGPRDSGFAAAKSPRLLNLARPAGRGNATRTPFATPQIPRSAPARSR